MVTKTEGPGSFQREQTDENGVKLGTFETIQFGADESLISDGISNWIVKKAQLSEDNENFYVNNQFLVKK